MDEKRNIIGDFDAMHETNALIQQAIDKLEEQHEIERENEQRTDKLFKFFLVILGAIAGSVVTLLVEHFLRLPS